MHRVRRHGARLSFHTSSQTFTVSRTNSYLSSTQTSTSTRFSRRSLTLTKALHSQQHRQHATSVDALTKPPNPSESFLQGNNAEFIDEAYKSWKEVPESVHVSWATYFRNLEAGIMPSPHIFQLPSAMTPRTPPGQNLSAPVSAEHSNDIIDHLKVQRLVRAYQSRGHYKAKLDPLGIRGEGHELHSEKPVELELDHYGFTEANLKREFTLGPGILPRFATETRKSMPLRDIIAACEATYCSSYGVEYLHIPDREKCDWIRNRIEVPSPIKFPAEERKRILDRLIWSSNFEKFLATKFPNEKRYGLEGAEALIPGVKAMIDRAVDVHGVEEIVMGCCHRGRLNFLSNVLRKPNESIFNLFSSAPANESSAAESGDVKYHLGMNHERTTPSGNRVRLSVVANPSHLEAEDPVVAGKTRATQHYKGDHDRSKVLCFTSHGDAAIAGQGIVYETMGLSRLAAYTTGGTIHVLVNNQIGFTTNPMSSRSTMYCSDIAKVIDAPIFHVNADDVEAVTFFCQLAADWRAKFQTDCVVDIVCYRKHGHNEMDQPMFTQPLMYRRIAEKIPVLHQYVNKLMADGVATKDEIEKHKQWVWDNLSTTFDGSKDYKPDLNEKEWLTSPWDGFKSPQELRTEVLPQYSTAVSPEILKEIADKISTVPDGFTIHKNLHRILAARKIAVDEENTIDWSTAEAFAFGTLCLEGHHVRVSGQDVERGTFSQRHAVLHNQEDDLTWTALDKLSEEQARFTITNSSLSEFGVLGFDYGYSLASPNALVMWEAQFGDFANNCQVIIDQFIASGEAKWKQRSGIVLSLPHGYDGQGPEHSSGRIERFLQCCNEDPRTFPYDNLNRLHQDSNMQVVCLTTPANLFHVLRRQQHRQFRKPLVIFFSKSLLRHPLARSKIEDFTGNSQFQYVIEDPIHQEEGLDRKDVERVILCSGQVYAALHKHRKSLDAQGIKHNTAITRLEQLHPFPWSQVKQNLDSYSNAKTIVWCQEEALNGGSWQHVQPRIETVLRETVHHNQRRVQYVGRGPSSSVATGLKSIHVEEERQLLEESFSI